MIGQNGRGASGLLDAEQSVCWPPGRAALVAVAAAVPLAPLGSILRMRVVPVEEQPAASGVVVGVVTEQPAPASGVVVGVVTAQPGASSGGAARGVVDQTLAMLDGLAEVPLGADVIETWNTDCFFFPPYLIAPMAGGEVRPRKPGTNAFLNPQHPDPQFSMTFSADGTAKQGCGSYKKRPGSQKRAFQKVDARDLAGKWRGCFCFPVPVTWPLLPIFYTTKTALNEDQYEESGTGCVLALPCPVETTTRTRRYVNGHATNGFAKDGGAPHEVHWHRDPGCAAGGLFFAKKAG